MFIRRIKEKEREYFSSIQQYIIEQNNQRPKGIHSSDLISPLKAFYNHFKPKPFSEKELGLFFSGNAFEHFFSHTVASKCGIKPKQYGDWNGILYEMDFLDESFQPGNPAYLGIPIDTKATRSAHRYKDEAKGYKPEMIDNLSPSELEDFFDIYVQQMKNYMVISWSMVSYLVLFFYDLTVAYKNNIMHGTKTPALRVYEINFVNEAELHEHYYRMFATRDLIAEALNTGDPKSLPPCKEWMCKTCPHFIVDCQGAAAQRMVNPVEF